jgi:hypothetical protein
MLDKLDRIYKIETFIYKYVNKMLMEETNSKNEEVQKEQLNQDFEQFYAEIIKMGEVLRLTIPKNIVDGADLKTGQRLKVIITKI